MSTNFYISNFVMGDEDIDDHFNLIYRDAKMKKYLDNEWGEPDLDCVEQKPKTRWDYIEI